MKIQKRSNRNKVTISSIALILIFALIGLGLWVYNNYGSPFFSKDDGGTNYQAPSEEQIAAGNAAKQQTIEDDLASRDDPKLNPQDTEAGDDVAIHITAASVEGDTLYIRTEIEGIYSEGSCKLTLTKNDVTVMKSAGVQPLPKSTTCKGFNIPVSELSRGTWAIEVQTSVSGSSASAKGSVEV